MATTITAATLTVTVSEEITLNNNNYNSTITKEIASIGNYARRIFTVLASSTHTLAEFASSATNDKFDLEDTKYVRVTNLDDTSDLTLTLGGSSVAAGIKIPAGGSHVLFSPDINGAASGSALTSTASLVNLYIHNATGAAVDIVLVVATL